MEFSIIIKVAYYHWKHQTPAKKTQWEPLCSYNATQEWLNMFLFDR